MILTNQQKYIVEVLKQLKYLRVRQLHAMMQAHFGPLGIEIGEHRLNVMLRQLRMASNFVFLKKDLITYGQREISEHYAIHATPPCQTIITEPSKHFASGMVKYGFTFRCNQLRLRE